MKIEIEKDTLNAIMAYLGTKPFQEVHNLIAQLQKEAAPQLKQEAAPQLKPELVQPKEAEA